MTNQERALHRLENAEEQFEDAKYELERARTQYSKAVRRTLRLRTAAEVS